MTSNLDGLLCLNLSSSLGLPITTVGNGATVLGVEIIVAVLLLVEGGLKLLEAGVEEWVTVVVVVVLAAGVFFVRKEFSAVKKK